VTETYGQIITESIASTKQIKGCFEVAWGVLRSKNIHQCALMFTIVYSGGVLG